MGTVSGDVGIIIFLSAILIFFSILIIPTLWHEHKQRRAGVGKG